MAKLGVSAIRINCQDLRPEVYGVEKMEIVTDYSEVVIETSNLIMKKKVLRFNSSFIYQWGFI